MGLINKLGLWRSWCARMSEEHEDTVRFRADPQYSGLKFWGTY